MSQLCLGYNKNKTRCRRKCMNTSYCRYHQSQVSNDDCCSICLMTVEKQEDCQLICNH
ncbi:MAG TPA: hypothetical protein VLG50_08015 [Candidatus Saccharimonadales bacterium]|nr:hypothetical protein [Candidatus Saccharimonadales bacterium]